MKPRNIRLITMNAPYRFSRGNLVAAATCLRLGFVANSYVAEILSGNPNPTPLAIWHGSDLSEPVTAQEYVGHYGDLWKRTSGHSVRALAVFASESAGRASQRPRNVREALLEFHCGSPREILDREEAARRRIDDTVSKEIVRSRMQTVKGGRFRPGLYPAAKTASLTSPEDARLKADDFRSRRSEARQSFYRDSLFSSSIRTRRAPARIPPLPEHEIQIVGARARRKTSDDESVMPRAHQAAGETLRLRPRRQTSSRRAPVGCENVGGHPLGCQCRCVPAIKSVSISRRRKRASLAADCRPDLLPERSHHRQGDKASARLSG